MKTVTPNIESRDEIEIDWGDYMFEPEHSEKNLPGLLAQS